MRNRRIFDLNPEVESALSERRAIVALESTVIAHAVPTEFGDSAPT
jgi:pseudouridine-5'-phosphate glycosidase